MKQLTENQLYDMLERAMDEGEAQVEERRRSVPNDELTERMTQRRDDFIKKLIDNA